MNLPNVFYYVAAFIGLVTCVIGLCAAFRPLLMAPKFGVPANESGIPYVISTGIRDVFIGLTVLILFYFQQWRPLGWIHLCISLVAVCDFAVVRKYGDKKISYVHLVSAISVIIYGLWLMAQSA